jgi:bacteriorhodopsin
MATGSGKTYVLNKIEHHHLVGAGPYDILIYREVFYGRLIEWFLSSPFILLNLALLAGLAWIDVLIVLIADEMMMASGLMGAVVRQSW